MCQTMKKRRTYPTQVKKEAINLIYYLFPSRYNRQNSTLIKQYRLLYRQLTRVDRISGESRKPAINKGCRIKSDMTKVVYYKKNESVWIDFAT